MHKPTFDQWLNQRYGAPKAILLDALGELSQWAASFDALIDAETIQRLGDQHFNGQAKSFYLKNRAGIGNQKQWGAITLGETNNMGKGTPVVIPIFLIRTYKYGLRGNFSTAKFLWRKYREETSYPQKLYSRRTDQHHSYSEVCAKLFEEQAQHKEAQDKMTEAAHQAAQAVTERIINASTLATRLPSCFQGHNLPSEVCGPMRILESTIQARLYSRSKDQWVNTTLHPRNIIIPIMNLESGEFVNCQSIDPNGKGLKTFLPGAFISGAFSPIHNNADSWVITEGYKTGLAVNAMDNANIAVALSANNVPKVAQALRLAFGKDVPIFTATDNDKDGKAYADKAMQQSGTKRIIEPDLFDSADWADVTKTLGLARAAAMYHANKS